MRLIDRQTAIDKFIGELEEIFLDIREREVDDSVCGLCEYDGAYMGQSGDWCNECPGFDRDDCFKLSDKIRKEWTDEIIKALPSAQPEPESISEWKKEFREYVGSLDIARDDWKGIIEYIDELPSIQPEIIRCKDCKHSRFFDPCFYCYEMGGEIIVPENGFCFKAERKINATD